jgi:hypothetical protein
VISGKILDKCDELPDMLADMLRKTDAIVDVFTFSR